MSSRAWRNHCLVILAACVTICADMPLVSADGGGGGSDTMARRGQTTDDQRHTWNFDTDKIGEPPIGLAAATLGQGPAGRWTIEGDPQSPSPPNRLVQEAACTTPQCLHVLLSDGARYDYPDVTVRLRTVGEGVTGAGGIVFAARDARNFYAALVDLSTDTLEVLRVVNGEITVMGHEVVKRKPTTWHFLRAQHNTNLSKDYIEVSFDGHVVFSTWDTHLDAGRIGLVTRGVTPIAFDNLFAIQLFSQRPLSPPAAY